MGAVIFYLITLMLLGSEQRFLYSDERPASERNILQYGESVALRSLDPFTGSATMPERRFQELLFNALVRLEPDGSIVGELAENWVLSLDQPEITFYLRKDGVWHDGQPFQAKDVVFTYQVLTTAESEVALFHRQIVKDIVRTEILHPFAVRFYFREKAVISLRSFLFKIIPQHRFKGPKLMRQHPFCQNPVGTGPFRFIQKGSHGEITLSRHERYFVEPAAIRKVILRIIPDPELLRELLTQGGIDLIPEVRSQDLFRLRSQDQIRLLPYQNPNYTFVAFNRVHPELNKLGLRQALTLAVNKEQLKNQMLGEAGEKMDLPISWKMLDEFPPIPAPVYNPRQAQRLLDSLGFRKQGSFYHTSTGDLLTFDMTVLVTHEHSSSMALALALKEYWRKVGVEVVLEPLTFPEWSKAVMRDHQFDLALGKWIFELSENVSDIFYSKNDYPGGNNFISYQNSEVDHLIEEIPRTKDPESKKDLRYKLCRKIAGEYPYIFLWTQYQNAAVRQRVRRTEIHPVYFFSYVQKWFIQN